VEVELVATVVEVVLPVVPELAVVGAELDGVTVGVVPEHAAAKTARLVTMTYLALTDPPPRRQDLPAGSAREHLGRGPRPLVILRCWRVGGQGRMSQAGAGPSPKRVAGASSSPLQPCIVLGMPVADSVRRLLDADEAVGAASVAGCSRS